MPQSMQMTKGRLAISETQNHMVNAVLQDAERHRIHKHVDVAVLSFRTRYFDPNVRATQVLRHICTNPAQHAARCLHIHQKRQ